MKRIDTSPEGIFEIAWSPDSKWVAYILGEDEVRIANVDTGEIRVIGPGSSPNITANLDVVLERGDEIFLISAKGQKQIVTRKHILKDTPKRTPLISPDGSQLLISVCNVFDKTSQANNAFPYRHFLALLPLGKGKPQLTTEQWYGGGAAWFPDSKRFVHFEFDSTAGPQIHVVSADGTHEGTMSGLYPSVSPDGSHIAVRPRGGGSVAVYSTKNTWSDQDVDIAVVKIPDSGSKGTYATPPVWLDNRYVIVSNGTKIWRLDTKRDKADEMKKLPLPTERSKHTMIASPDRDKLAIEVEGESGYELRIVPLG